MPPGLDNEFGGHSLQPVPPTPMEYLPDGHSEHGAEPFVCLNDPGGHASQGPPSCPVKPALHLQSVWLSLDAGAFELMGQVKHKERFFAAYISLGQGWHALTVAAAGTSQYLPLEHR
jgi:hypothetical protein